MQLESRDRVTARPLASNEPWDVDRIRADFPILSREVHGKPLIYLDNGASAQKPNAVLDALDRAYRNDYANVHRGLHYLSNTATAKFEDARETTRRFLNAPTSEQIIFTRNATSAINLVAQSFGGLRIGERDEIVLSIMEHHSNIVPWHFHRERHGAVLKWVPVSDAGEFDLADFENALTPRTKMVAITHMSNVLGTVVPIKQLVAIAHARGIPVLVDGSQSAVHMTIDVQDLGCDFYVFTGHKTYGPSGTGVLYAKREHLDAMPPYEGGGEMIETVTTDTVTYGVTPHRFEAGTPAIAEVAGLGAALDYMMKRGREHIAAHEQDLKTYAHETLMSIPDLTIYGTAQSKGAIVAFNLDGIHPHDVSTLIDRSGIAIRAGHHCAQPLMARLGVTATCRASFAMYNTTKEIDSLRDALLKTRKFFA